MPKKKSDSAVDAAANQSAAPAAESQTPTNEVVVAEQATVQPAAPAAKKAKAPRAKVAAPAVAAVVEAEVAEPEVVQAKVEPAAPKAVAKTPAPKTMEELLNGSNYALVVPKRGTTVIGKVTGKNRKMLTLDIGAKTEGVVIDKEFEVAAEYIDELEIGQDI